VLASIVRHGKELRPLPATRAEVEGLGALFGEEASLWLGAEATEERATGLSKQTSIVHLACHGVVDERFPLNSALALTIREEPEEGQANGLLQAWEIFERVRIDADLVTLSACETALGKEVAGEGIVGLTRAFQYAGARTVLASLWSVTDVSTAELMKRFYKNLKAGDSKDVALQKAQLDFIREPITIGAEEEAIDRDFSHPFFWAAFQLIGDWK
jgi:CHAT domain-containing protein